VFHHVIAAEGIIYCFVTADEYTTPKRSNQERTFKLTSEG